MQDQPDTRITMAQAAKILGVSAGTVRRLIRLGHLEDAGRRPSPLRDAAILVRRADVERLAEEGWPGRVVRRRDRGSAPR